MEALTRWPVYQAGRGADPYGAEAMKYLPAYVAMRVRGALIDSQRSADWVTRTERQVIKAQQDAEVELGPGSSLADQARHAGVDPEQARKAMASAERRPGRVPPSVAGRNRARP